MKKPTNKEQTPIITKSGVQLPKITAKRKETERTQTPSKGKEPVEQFKEATKKDQYIVSDILHLKANVLGTLLTSLFTFPKRLQNTKLEKQFMKFLKILKKLHVNIPLIDTILQILIYSKFFKEMLTKKRKIPNHPTQDPYLKIQGISLYLGS